MFDATLLPRVSPLLDRLAQRLAAAKWRADTVTLCGFGIGAMAATAAAVESYLLAALLFLLNRLADGLDGALARRLGPTERGGYLDITLDFLIYAGFVLAFAIARPQTNGLAACLLLFAFMGTASSFLAFAAIAARRGLTTDTHGPKAIYYLGGLTEGTETIVVFVLFCLLPDWFPGLAASFAVLCIITAIARIHAGWQEFGDTSFIARGAGDGIDGTADDRSRNIGGGRHDGADDPYRGVDDGASRDNSGDRQQEKHLHRSIRTWLRKRIGKLRRSCWDDTTGSASTTGGIAAHRLSNGVRVGLWMACAALGFGSLVGMARMLSTDLDVLVIAFWRNALSLVFFVPWAMRAGSTGRRMRRGGLYLLRAVVMVVSGITLFLAVSLMPLAEATALSFTSPLFATILAVFVLGERVDRHRWMALLVGFVGVTIVLRPGAAALSPAAVLVLVSAATFAAVIVTGKRLAATESPAAITFYLSVFSIPLSLVPALFVWEWPSAQQFLWLGAIALAGIVNLYSLSRALRIGDASMAMPFDFLRLPATAAVGFLAFAQVPDIWTWVGAAVIFASSILVARGDRMTKAA